MGGYGSGRRHNHFKKDTVEEGIRLSVVWLARAGYLQPGTHSSGSWSWRAGTQVCATIEYTLNLQIEEDLQLRLAYSIGGRLYQDKLRLSTTQPHYGGL